MGKSVWWDISLFSISKWTPDNQERENQPALKNTSSSAETLHWFAIGNNVSVSPITAEHPVGQLANSQAVERVNANSSRTAACRLGARPHYKSRHRLTGSTWREAAGQSRSHRSRGGSCATPMSARTFQMLPLQRQLVGRAHLHICHHTPKREQKTERDSRPAAAVFISSLCFRLWSGLLSQFDSGGEEENQRARCRHSKRKMKLG